MPQSDAPQKLILLQQQEEQELEEEMGEGFKEQLRMQQPGIHVVVVRGAACKNLGCICK